MSIISIIADRFLEELLLDLSQFEASSTAQPAVIEQSSIPSPAQLPPQTAQLSFQPAQLSIEPTDPIATEV